MGKLTPITEQFQHFVRDLKESFRGDLNGRAQAAMKQLLEEESRRQRDRYWCREAYERRDRGNFTTAQAAVIYDGKFVAVGTNEEALQYAGPDTRKIDLGGRTVIPGLVETHHHTPSYSVHFFPKDSPRPAQTDPPIPWTN